MPDLEEANHATASENQLVTFELGGEEFGFDIMSVQEIIRIPKVSRLPRTPEYVEGLANLRGVVLPIIDTRARFGLPRAEETDRTRVLVIDNHGTKVGLRVDRVKQVTRMSSADVEQPPEVIRGVSANYLSGVVKLDQGRRIIMALSPEKVCGIELTSKSRSTESLATAGTQHAGVVETQSVDAVEQLVTFTLGNEEFAFAIANVREILRVQAPNEVPDTPAYVLGVLTVRGKILPILDLRLLLQQKPLVEEMCERVSALRIAYNSALEQVRQRGLTAAAQALEATREWLAEFSSSSETLTHTLAQLRASNESAIRQVGITRQSKDPSIIDRELVPAMSEAAQALIRVEQLIPTTISEDQRIVVVEANGVLLGLVVDHVNEVLNVNKAAIDEPPLMGGQNGLALSGIAKLNDGARLIMLLDSGALLQDKSLGDLRVQGDNRATVHAAENIAGRDGRVASEQQFVTFRLGTEEFGVPIAHIQEIDRYSQITRIPKAPHFVEGVTNLRGEVIPVLDARKRFGMELKESDDRTRIIIVDLGGVKTGLLVDSVSQVLNISAKDIAPPPSATESEVDTEFLSGIANVENGKRMIILLDVQKILSKGEQAKLKKAAGRS